MNTGRRSVVIAVLVIAALVTAGFVYGTIRTARVETRLLELPADAVPSDEALLAFATERGPYLFVENCAACHGEDMRGDAKRGVPDLQDAIWLYGDGKISDIENTIQYGIRSGHPKAHNVTDMPAFRRTGQLSAAEIDDVVEYVLSVADKPHDEAAARRGAELYQNKGNCFDCHSSDVLGNPDYGAPALTGPAWCTAARVPRCSNPSRTAATGSVPPGSINSARRTCASSRSISMRWRATRRRDRPTNRTLGKGARLSFLDFSQAHTRRSLTLLAIGALIGLGIAGYGLFTAQGTATRSFPAEAIATVNGRLILRTDFVTQVQTQFGVPFAQSTAGQRQRVLDDMIAEELMVQRGLEADLASYDPDVRQALVNGVELQIFADVLARQPNEAQLKDYYEKNKARYVRDGIMQLRDLMIPAGAGSQQSPDQALPLAGKAIQALRHGKPLDAVMSAYGLRDSRKLLDSGHIDTGDVFDFSAKARLDPKVFEAASKLSAGEISDPVMAADGVHIVVMVKRDPPRRRPFGEVSNEVWTDLKKNAQDQVRQGNLKYLAGKADIRIAERKW